MLYYLYSNGSQKIPVLYWFGKYEEIPTLIMSKYEQTMEEYFINHHKKISNDVIDHWVKQMINIIETIHSHYVIHCDIKPQNFMLKNDNLYLIDFGLSTVFVNEKKEIISSKQKNTYIFGTPKYISYYIHDGWDPSCRDDYISIGYIWMYLILGYLPWENLTKSSSAEYNEKHILHPINQIRMQMKSIESITNKMTDINKNCLDYISQMYKKNDININILIK